MEEIKISAFIRLLRKNEIFRGMIPMEMVSGLPIVTMKKEQIYITVPYFIQKLKPNDQTLIYPLSCCVTALWPKGKIIDIRRLAFSKEFERLDFSKPIGTFRHEAIRNLTREEYQRFKQDLLECYDELIHCLCTNTLFSNHAHMRALADMLIEPYQKPLYRLLNTEFYDAYLSIN